jgi:type III pantothenate kinase
MKRLARSAAPTDADSHTLLLLDVGNSRLKWAMRAPLTRRAGVKGQAEPFQKRGVIPADALRRSSAALNRVVHSVGSDARIYVCNVAGRPIVRQLRSLATAAGLRPPRFVRSSASSAGVRNGYAEAWRLGVDRWVALIGAHHEYPGRDLCIVGMGSAMTVDVITREGRHRGGCIVPGPQMMLQALLQNTAGIRRRAAVRGADALHRLLAETPVTQQLSLFAHDTRSGLLAGCRYACARLIDDAVREARKRFGHRLNLIVTGGGAALITSLLRESYQRDEDLVLRGLAVLATAPKTAGRKPRRGRTRN